jgi:Flp pilus assembly protein TadD
VSLRLLANRGIAKFKLENKQGAIADLRKAALLSRQQGERELYQEVISLLRMFEGS